MTGRKPWNKGLKMTTTNNLNQTLIRTLLETNDDFADSTNPTFTPGVNGSLASSADARVDNKAI